MMPPFGGRLDGPPEHLNFRRRTGEIAKVGFGPRQPSCDRHRGRERQYHQRRQGGAQHPLWLHCHVLNKTTPPAIASAGTLLTLVRYVAANARPMAMANPIVGRST